MAAESDQNRGLSWRGLSGIALGAGGLAVGGVTGYAAASEPSTTRRKCHSARQRDRRLFGTHQAGIATPRQAHVTFIGLDLRREVNREALVRMMQLLTDDIVRLTPPGIGGPTTGVGRRARAADGDRRFGEGLLSRPASRQRAPTGSPQDCPGFVDEPQPRWSDGDLMLQVAAEDPVTVSHAVRVHH